MSFIYLTRLFCIFFMLSLCLVCALQTSAQESSLAEQIFQTYQEILLREDVQAVLPAVLIELRKPSSINRF